jgi:hypothetical protein
MDGKLGKARTWINSVLSELNKPEPNIKNLKSLHANGIEAYLFLTDVEHEVKKMFCVLLGDSDLR